MASYGANKRVVISGAGPAGVTAGIHLARRGYSVQLFDKMEAPPDDAPAGRHAYPMIVTSRGTRPVREAGASPPILDPSLHTFNRNHALGRTGARSSASDPALPPAFVTTRQALAGQLLQQAAALHPTAVTSTFGAALDGLDLAAKTATFVLPGGERSVVPYDLFVGADGANSRTRDLLLEAHVPGFEFDTLYRVTTGYKTFTGLPIPAAGDSAGVFAGHPRMEDLYWLAATSQKGKSFVVAMWQPDERSMSGIVFGVEDWADVSKEVAAAAPWLPPAWPDLIGVQVSDERQDPSFGGRMVRTSQFHGPSCVLLGDAAHAVTSNLGQGCNAALEDVGVFVRQLDAAGGDLEVALPAYTAARMPDVAALQRLEMLFMLARSPARISSCTWWDSLEARLVFTGAMVASLALPKALLNLTLLPARPQQPLARGSGEGAGGRGGGAGQPHKEKVGTLWLFEAFRDADVPYSALLRAMRVQAALVVAAAGAAVAAMAWGAAALLPRLLRAAPLA